MTGISRSGACSYAPEAPLLRDTPGGELLIDFGKIPGTLRLLPLTVWLIVCLSFADPVPVLAKDVLIAWDGLDGIVTGYKVYWGQSSRVYDWSADAGARTEFIIRGLQDGITYYFAATAYDTNRNESDFSQEAVLPPAADVSGSPNTAGGCFIATAAYGSSLAPEVRTLREFRDAHLMTNRAGRLLVKAYYSISPPVADLIRESDFLKALTRWALSPVVYAIKNPAPALLIMALTAAGWLLSGRVACFPERRRPGRPARYAAEDLRKGRRRLWQKLKNIYGY